MENTKKILVVEDDQFMREFYQELLTEEGYEVEIAADGFEGEQKFLAGGYDLVLLDIMLPKKDGLEILRDAKNKPPKVKNGPIVILTNLGQDAIIKEGFTLGASGYIIKSAMAPDEILNEINMFLNKKV